MTSKSPHHQSLSKTTLPPPLPTRWVIRILVILVVALALLAGYYHSSYLTEQRKYQRLEDRYVRVRGMLGREETQRLIDLSYEVEEEGTFW